ncbi:MAG: bifunctional precorrin-2 dehydrogenase/sirohydrochlorin ferrochelatase [Desulfatitalea sp.]|nr:bifunctional precorrin-2 dehydrogenase/sirohydrochlorin ferrochelatase [Desulfatitalea sp.]NNJ98984.1 bifunctional precorrin-2 dehydrogenase/sirohydrochlorin ferrochelatase [Desulfatitalea sp.]
MRYYPICLDIRNRRCLVVGGGQVGTRKVRTLLSCGARVTVVSPQISDALSRLARQDRIVWQPRVYRSSDLEGIFLVIGATDEAVLNRRIHRDAEQAGRLCNIADQPHLCNFILPAVIQQGDLMLAVSTAGKSPAFAKHLRKKLQAQFGPEYATFLDLMGAVRHRLLSEAHSPEAHKPLFERLIAGDLLEMIRRDDHPGINALLGEVLGAGYRYEALLAKTAHKRLDP